MSHPGPRRKLFECGCRGFGQYCHNCYHYHGQINGIVGSRKTGETPTPTERPEHDNADSIFRRRVYSIWGY